MKEQIKAPETIQLSNEEIDSQPIRCTVRSKHWKSGFSQNWLSVVAKIEEKMKAMKTEVKENVQGTNSDGKETRTQINGLEQKEKINIQQNRMKKQELKKMRRGLGTSGTTLNIPTPKS